MSTEAAQQHQVIGEQNGTLGAFGVAIRSDAALPGLTSSSGATGSRHLDHHVVSAKELRKRCDQSILSRLGSDGDGPLKLEYYEYSTGGLLAKTASFGDHLITDGGRTALSAVDSVDEELWQRYVLGQVFPLAASVQGLEVFHASAVVIDNSVVAMAGPSGVGKSAIATALIEQGATFFTDDVLALDVGASEMKAYPGTTLMGVPNYAIECMADSLFAGPPWATDEHKSLIPVRGERRVLPMLALLLLTPTEDEDDPSFAPCLPNNLMATTFDGVSRSPERLRRLLRISAMLAGDGCALELRYSRGQDPAIAARAILDRLDKRRADR